MIETMRDYFSTQPVEKAWVFGSYSRGEETSESDVDIMVLLDKDKHIGLQFFAMHEDMKQLLGREVDLMTEQSLTSFARPSAMRDRILVYERAS